MNHNVDRVAGWDLLRGLCAITVATYHLLYWLHIAELPALGTYGVYLFFVLSGASLAYNYGPEHFGNAGGLGRFLLTRWLRLAPLYIVLCFVFLAMLAGRDGGVWVDRIPQRLAMNATFAFGVDDPAVWALLVGGWSLGIEFVYYLFFPFLVMLIRHPGWSAIAWTLLAAVQWWWIQRTIGTDGWVAASVAYHQVPAFVAYFFGGCLIGHWRKQRTTHWPFAAGAMAWLGMGALLFAFMPAEAGDELLGVHGAILFAACFAVVFVSGKIEVRGRLEPLSSVFGDITYGTYLLHPILFWSLAWFVMPDVTQAPLPVRVIVLLFALAATTSLAYASERWFERPLRRLARPKKPASPHIEAASISS